MWSASVTVAGGDTEGVVTFVIACNDLTRNRGAIVADTLDTTVVIVGKCES